MTEIVSDSFQNLLDLEIMEEGMDPVHEAIEKQKRFERRVRDLKAIYDEQYNCWSEIQRKACTLSGECKVTKTDLMDTLITLFNDSYKYYCPHCGRKMAIGSKTEMSYEPSYYMFCEGCKQPEPTFNSVLDAYLAWFNKCNNRNME